MSISYSLYKNKLRKTIIDAMYNEVITKTSRYYHFLGKENTWTDFLSPFIPSNTVDEPGPPQNNFRYDLHVRRDILTTKAITPSDVSYVIRRIDWIYGEVYDMYDDSYTPEVPAYSGAGSLEEANFYVLTTDYNVYKCIWNNGNIPSTTMPTGTTTNVFSTPDGYKWKFMYTIPISLRNRFLSAEYMPVTNALKSQFYLNGEITQIVIEDGGVNYDPSSYAVVSGDGYLEDNPYIIEDLTIIQGGLGYTSAPSLTFDAPNVLIGPYSTADATVTISGGSVNAFTLVSSGYGYDEQPNIDIDEPIAYDDIWTASTLVSLGTILKQTLVKYLDPLDPTTSYNHDVYYEVTGDGTTGLIAPGHSAGSEMNGSAELTIIATRAVIKPVMQKTEADISLIIIDGVITGVIINDGGIGYTNANIEIFDPTGNGSGSIVDSSGNLSLSAVLVPNFSVGNVNTLQANVELLAIPGALYTARIVNGGTGYGAASVNIKGDGTGASAIALVNGGQVTEIVFTNPGSGYTWVDLEIIGNGTGAVAAAIMSPIKGHGHDAIDELNANSLMFYSSISRDKNQGIEINNDYRKVGLLKNITQFGSNARFTDDIGSGCVLVTGTFDKTKLSHDMLLTGYPDTYKNYRIVDFTDTQILVSVFNNFSIYVGDTLRTEDNYVITVTGVQERTIDQFSGDMLFISVREPYSPTAEQIITVRTVITI